MTIEDAVTAAPRTFREAEVRIERQLPGYESRPQQRALAASIEEALARGNQLMAEAGTGTGKSYGALIPAILSGKRVIVSTTTKALQDQYARNDLPWLEEHLGVPFRWAVLKGRSNYACLAKLAEIDKSLNPWATSLKTEIDNEPYLVGDIESFETPVTPEQFSRVTMSADECPGKSNCPFGKVCLAEKAKDRAAEANVVIVNTALLVTDMRISTINPETRQREWGYLGYFDAVIIDEAHATEEVATGILGEKMDEEKVERLVTDLSSFFARTGQHEGQAGRRAQDATRALFERLRVEKRREAERESVHGLTHLWMVNNFEPIAEVIEALRALDAVALSAPVDGETQVSVQKARLRKRINNMIKFLEEICFEDDASLARWVEDEEKGRGAKRRTVLVLKSAPVRVSGFFRERLWSLRTPADKPITSVLMSATMTTGRNDFRYLQDRLGVDGPETLDVGSPFDYERQARLFLPRSTDPSPKDGGWSTYATRTTMELIRASGGGALLLFTSGRNMNLTHRLIAEDIEEMGLNVYKQGGDLPNSEIAQRFKEDTNSVLFGLASFMTGFDAPGDSCRLVVIDKLPFAVPSDPIFAARAKEIDDKGGRSFNQLSIPQMTLTLIQAFGRLIRRTSDYGAVAILDSRLTSAGWGRKIADGLPPAPRTSDLNEIRQFYAGIRRP